MTTTYSNHERRYYPISTLLYVFFIFKELQFRCTISWLVVPGLVLAGRWVSPSTRLPLPPPQPPPPDAKRTRSGGGPDLVYSKYCACTLWRRPRCCQRSRCCVDHRSSCRNPFVERAGSLPTPRRIKRVACVCVRVGTRVQYMKRAPEIIEKKTNPACVRSRGQNCYLDYR